PAAVRGPARGGPAPRPGAARRRASDRRAAPGPVVPGHPAIAGGPASGGDAPARGAVATRDRRAAADDGDQCRRPPQPGPQDAPRPARRGGSMSERSSPADWERWQADWEQPGAAPATAR